jgi:hypothetical protein
MKLKLFAVAATLALAACTHQAEWKGDPQLIYKLTSKMPEEEVQKILGAPTSTFEMPGPGPVTKSWTYSGAETLHLIIQNGKLIDAKIGNKTVVETSVNDL